MSPVRFVCAALFALMPLKAQAQDKIVLDGSTGMLPLATALASAYQQRAPGVAVQLGSGLGTRARLQALAEGRIHIALASHGIQTADILAGNLKVYEVAKSAVVFAVNDTVPVTRVEEAQVCDLYSGAIRTWAPLGGSDHAIVLLTRPASEVDAEVIRAKIACFRELKEVPSARVMPRSGDMAKALAETAHAVGMTSMTVVEQSAGKVRALALNGVAPTAQNVRSGRYFLTRDFLLIFKGEPAGQARQFLDFVLSDDGKRVIEANGAVPLR